MEHSCSHYSLDLELITMTITEIACTLSTLCSLITICLHKAEGLVYYAQLLYLN